MPELDQQRLRQARRAVFEDYRRQGASAWIVPQGTSMRPLIGADSWLLVEFGALPRTHGEILIFSLGELLVAHRFIGKRCKGGREWLIAKGDAEPYADQPVDPANVLGVVRALRRGTSGPASRLGCAGWSASLIASLSGAGGRSAWALRRAAAFLPALPRQIALRAISLFARVTAHLLFTPLYWAVYLFIEQSRKREGGEQHEAV